MHLIPKPAPISTSSVQRFAAFAAGPNGGNPAGVWIGEQLPDDETMQRIAADVGYSETAFVAPVAGPDRVVRYFSPEMEVPFCGHATIATGIALAAADGDGLFQLDTIAGQIPVSVQTRDGQREASFTSVAPQHEAASDGLVTEALSALGWRAADLDPTIPPAKAFAGAWHLVLAVASREKLDRLEYDFERLKTIMLRDGLITLQLVWRENDTLFHSRNPFPVGGVVEDPATGAAAAAFGGYLRDAKLIKAPATICIRQGEAMGRPSLINIEIPQSGGIVISGSAATIERAVV